MICAPTPNASVTKATASPMPMPSPASAIIQAATIPMEVSAGTLGHCANKAIVMLALSTVRARSKPVLRPGIGTKMNAPATRASVSRKPSRVDVLRTRLPPISAEVSEDQDRVGCHLLQHPRQGKDEGRQEYGKARDGAECGILNGGDRKS